MNRRDSIKKITAGAIVPVLWTSQGANLLAQGNSPSEKPAPPSIMSDWEAWGDMPWAGPAYWGNRLQDWAIINGEATCLVTGPNRSLHHLTAQINDTPTEFITRVRLTLLRTDSDDPSADFVGFCLGAKGKFPDYRSAAVFGNGLHAGITLEGKPFIGETKGHEHIATNGPMTLQLRAVSKGNAYTLELAIAQGTANPQSVLTVDNIPADALKGNIALMSHASKATNKPSVAFSQWAISGEKISVTPHQTFGPICFAQYTLSRGVLKLNAQLSPIETIQGHRAELQLKTGKDWKTVQEKPVHPMGRLVQFRIEKWKQAQPTPYRVKLTLPLRNGSQVYYYEGTIAKEPTDKAQVKTAVFSCNADYGFPDSDVAPNVHKHKPDLAVFLGDQFYESTGGFGVQTSPLNMAALDYLRKWMMFGWSYRDIFRHIPSAFIPDDHDVYHGNVWGEGGKHASTDQGFGYAAQDQGGYKMPPEWVNMVQLTQTSHLPDPVDPTPVLQDIGVYFTDWAYGGISFAILEDRKFKSAPKNALPPEAKVVNGFIQNPDFDIRKHRDIPANLLGERQMKFLNTWANDWRQGTEMKAVLSQTNFCALATLPEGSIIDEIVPRLPIPPPGEYVKGDAPTRDMDSNGWPQKGRDEALRALRKCFAFHIAGDQHLASVVHYGIDEFGDAGYAFAGPALNNLWPRRWWPTVPEGHRPLDNQPPYTGNFEDGFGNKVTVHAVANPHKVQKEPALIYDRATGYGIVVFDKTLRSVTVECWPRYVDPANPATGKQFQGWPLTVPQQGNYGKKATAYLPEIFVQGLTNPVVQLVDEGNNETVYSLRIRGNRFKPHVFREGNYRVIVGDPDLNKQQIRNNVKTVSEGTGKLEFKF